VEHHTVFQDFEDLYKALLLCLETIAQDKSRKKWDGKSKMEDRDCFTKLQALCSLLPFTLPSTFLDSPEGSAAHCRV